MKDTSKGKGTNSVHSSHVLVGSEESDGSVVASVSLHALEAANQMRDLALSKRANLEMERRGVQSDGVVEDGRRRVERERSICPSKSKRSHAPSAADARVVYLPSLTLWGRKAVGRERKREADAQGRMTGSPHPFALFQGMVSMWSVNVCPNTSLLLGGGFLGLEFLMTVRAAGCSDDRQQEGSEGRERAAGVSRG